MPRGVYERSPELRAKLSRGSRMRDTSKVNYASGSRVPTWRGDEVGYSALHIWVRRHKPRTGVCEHCGDRPEPMRDGRAATEFANISGEYRRDLSDYWELCRPCHARFDRGEIEIVA